MLRSCSKEDFDLYADFAYELALDLTKSGYPTYCDGVKTKERFIERSLKAFDREADASNEKAVHPWERVCLSKGMAVFRPGEDSTVAQVFSRADEEMYREKRIHKGK